MVLFHFLIFVSMLYAFIESIYFDLFMLMDLVSRKLLLGIFRIFIFCILTTLFFVLLMALSISRLTFCRIRSESSVRNWVL